MDVPQIDSLRVVSRSHQTATRAKTGVRLLDKSGSLAF